MKTTLDDFEIDVKRYNPLAGDVLVLRLTKELPMVDISRMFNQLQESFPECRCVVLSDGIMLDVIRPES